MSLLSDFEDRIARAVDTLFSGVFRSPVQPAELARAAAKEMDRQRTVGVGKVYAPNRFSILLSHEDAERLGRFASTLAGELATYLAGYAQERGYVLPTRPSVRFLVDEELPLGAYEVIGELASDDIIEAGRGSNGADAQTGLPDGSGGNRARTHPSELATITVPGIEHDIALTHERMIIGRLRSCEICLEDINVSREHAALQHGPEGWTITDLDSTNGTFVNGERISRALLKDGDVITVGVSELVFHSPGS